jgi:hypothetical protein
MTPRSTGPSGALLAGATVGRLLRRASNDAFPQGETGQEPTGLAACALPADRQAVGEARRFTWSTLSSWELSPLVDSAALIVSELLSNALRHGLGSSQDAFVHSSRVWLGILRRRQTVLFAVCDYSTDVPVLRSPDCFAQSGRGLHIVDCLSEAWGWTDPGIGGKAVWAAVSSPDNPDRLAVQERFATSDFRRPTGS